MVNLLTGLLLVILGIISALFHGAELLSITIITTLITLAMAYFFALAKSNIVEKSGPGSVGIFIAMLVFLADPSFVSPIAVLLATAGSIICGVTIAKKNQNK